MNENHDVDAASEKLRSDETRLRKVTTFARRHPAWSLLGVAGVGLFGGVELAAGVVIGAGLAAAIGRNGSIDVADAGHSLRERARELADRAPGFVDRARRAFHAAWDEIVTAPSQDRGDGSPSPSDLEVREELPH